MIVGCKIQTIQLWHVMYIGIYLISLNYLTVSSNSTIWKAAHGYINSILKSRCWRQFDSASHGLNCVCLGRWVLQPDLMGREEIASEFYNINKPNRILPVINAVWTCLYWKGLSVGLFVYMFSKQTSFFIGGLFLKSILKFKTVIRDF